ncbi:hypothetical protein HR12_48025, partial [Microbacterium sp. SUBG005]
IIASIIEREARSSEDFYKVSRVIENRLQPDNTETHGLLQMDSTAQYGAGELDAGSSSSSENALTSDNPWNTYIRPGLPIGPIANPGGSRDRRGDETGGRHLVLLHHGEPRHR